MLLRIWELRMKNKYLTLTTKFIVIVAALLLVANIITGFLLTEQSKSALKTLIDERMLDVTKTAAAMLNGDELKAITKNKEDTEEYRQTYKILKHFQDNTELTFIYVISPVADGNFIYIVDPADKDLPIYSEKVFVTDALLKAAKGSSAVDSKPYTNKFGTFCSAYSPVFDSEGNVAGIVGVNFNAEWYDAQVSKNIYTILTCSILSLLIGAVIVFIITSEIRRRFRKITSDLLNLNADVDNITRDIIGSAKINKPSDSSKDEIQEFAEKIHMMREEIQRYINHLYTQANKMIKALASNYSSVYYVNLDNDECICYQKNYRKHDPINEGDSRSYKAAFDYYAYHYVIEEYREDFLKFVEVDNVREALKTRTVIAYRYLAIKNNREVFEMLKMTRILHADEKANQRVNELSVGIINIDTEMRDDIAKNQALSDALNAAEEASKAKTFFLSNMSYEIRTPMNAIIGLGSLALNEPNLSDTMRNYLEKIGTSAQHLLSLINDILDMSRIESGRAVVKNEEFSLKKLIEQINTIFSGQCQEKEISFACRTDDEVGDYYIGDSIKLRQVLINLLGNAVKYTPEGKSVELLAEKAGEFDGKTALRFIVKDTGIGMSKEYLPKIFEAFSQEDSSAKNKYGSTGLGMAITKSIVDMLNGKIEVESEKGVGTTFTVVVTLINSDKAISSEQNEAEIRLQNMSVLVVDDDKIACEQAKLVLEQAGVSVETVLSGKDAVEMVKLRHARRNPYNLIIVDWQMPEMNGVEVTRQIRSIIGNETPIIIFTAYNLEDIMNDVISAGVDSFIAKPLFPSTLVEQFKSALRKKNTSADEVNRKADLKGRKILLAEDMPVNSEIMIMVLQMREMKTDLAENGKIAVEMFEKSPENYYDAILMDMRMPEMDGLEATQRIRALNRPDAKTIPIIALTANAFDEDVQRSLQAGLNAHLSKPVEPKVLFETLENMIAPQEI